MSIFTAKFYVKGLDFFSSRQLLKLIEKRKPVIAKTSFCFITQL